MTASHVHVVGAGLAGLAAALSLSARGIRVTLLEAGPAAGGRCRSYDDRELQCRIDNGNHLLLSGNRATFAYLDEIGGRGELAGPGAPIFPFADLATGERWALRLSRGRLPLWLVDRARRVPGTRARDYLQMLRLRFAGAQATVSDTLPDGPLYRRLLAPLAIAALNTMPEAGSARLLWSVIRETLAEGGRACVPAFPKRGLSETFVDPALACLRSRGVEVRLGRRVGALGWDDDWVVRLDEERVEAVILAVPAPVAASLLPALVTPDAFEAILNVHFRVDAAPGEAGFLGVVGGLSEWIFVKPGVVSVTISAANRYAERDSVAVMQQVWQETCLALGLSGSMPPGRVLREKRATFAATAIQEARRPPSRAGVNLVLAGDWTATGLPATIEGAIRSGRRAAETLVG